MIEQFYKDLDGLLRIPSVAESGDERYPFGKPCADALDYVLNLCDSFGFRTKKCENMLGWAEIGEGQEMIGILVHLDVVPEGSGWDYPAYALTRTTVDGEDRLYGRGVTDDKGPAMMAIYAMKVLLNSGVKLTKRVRIIFGLAEEGGDWADMAYYREHEELPTFGFTPDASFAVGCAEKGIAVFELKMPLSASGVDSVSGGNAHNMVPDHCECVINGEKFEASGVSAHAAGPMYGVNAIIALMQEVLKNHPDCALADFITKKFESECLGYSLGIASEDKESGKLTLNLGVIEVRGDEVVMTVDIRYPVTKSYSSMLTMIKAACKLYGITVTEAGHNPPIFMDKDSKLITTLAEVYGEISGTYLEPHSMGGGTYARAMPNIVSFGPHFPGSASTEHQKNEYVTVADVDKAVRIYAQTLFVLMEE